MSVFDIRIDHYFHPASDGLRADIADLKGVIMASMEQLAADLTALTEQSAKIGTETRSLLVQIEDLLSKLGQTTPEVDAAVLALKAQLQVVDELVKDAEPPQP